MVTQEPRYSCELYFIKNRIQTPGLLPKSRFDRLVKRKQFKDGPFEEKFGDGEHHPYNSEKRQAFGILQSGRGVYCELPQEEE